LPHGIEHGSGQQRQKEEREEQRENVPEPAAQRSGTAFFKDLLPKNRRRYEFLAKSYFEKKEQDNGNCQ
jgi:hypothetical protein